LPPPNNGMHPTADTLLLIYLQSCGAAGDAGRYGSAPSFDRLWAACAPVSVARLEGCPRGVCAAGFARRPVVFRKRARAAARLRCAITTACT
jgi:hypothetical protein